MMNTNSITINNSNKPYISVIVPVYNTEKYLKKCIDSVLNQEFTNFELILVDDGSTDSSIDIIKSYMKFDNRVKGYYIQGKGPAEPRNYGTDRAIGKYIYYLDSDDYLPENALSELVLASIAFPHADFIKGSHRVLIDDTEYVTKYAEQRRPFANKELDSDTALLKIIHGHNIPCNILYRKEFIDNHAIKFNEDITYLEDGPFIMEFFSHNPIAVYVDKETYIYRLCADGSVTNTKMTPMKVKSLILGSKRYNELLSRFDKSSDCYKECQNQGELYILGALKSIIHLQRKDKLEMIEFMKKMFPTLPYPQNIKDKILVLCYNLFPFILNCLK